MKTITFRNEFCFKHFDGVWRKSQVSQGIALICVCVCVFLGWEVRLNHDHSTKSSKNCDKNENATQRLALRRTQESNNEVGMESDVLVVGRVCLCSSFSGNVMT